MHFVIGHNNFEYKQDDRIRSWATDGCLEVPLGYNKAVYERYMESYVSIAVANSFLTNNCGLNMEHDLPKFIRHQKESDTNNKTDTPNSEPESKISELQIEEIKDLISNATAEITRLQNELATYELIKRHRERAAGFNALIETLEYHASEYDSDKQPLKKKVAETFNRKAQLKEDNRRGEEAARILGLPEKNS